MKVVYEQGDIVWTNNNQVYAIVLEDWLTSNEVAVKKDTVKILEISGIIRENNVPRSCLEYKGKCDLRKEFLAILGKKCTERKDEQ